MILVDTSVWIDHLRSIEPLLVQALNAGRVLAHPFVTGELACGRMHNAAGVRALLQSLPAAPIATEAEVLGFIDRRALAGTGIGYVDAHLLCATALAGTAQLWTRDRRLAAIADSLGIGHTP